MITNPGNFKNQHPDLGDDEILDLIVISFVELNGEEVPLSRYGDSKWRFIPRTTNVGLSEQFINFEALPPIWVGTMKEILFRYMKYGRSQSNALPSMGAVQDLFGNIKPFLYFLTNLKIIRFSDINPFVCSLFVEKYKGSASLERSDITGKKLKATAIVHYFSAVEAIYELSQYIDDSMPQHPWPDTSAAHLAGMSGIGTYRRAGITPLMPDDVYVTLFQRAWLIVDSGHRMLDLRDKVVELSSNPSYKGPKAAAELVKSNGYADMFDFNSSLLELRDACYIIVASLSGCRNHEISFIERGACYSTTEIDSAGDSCTYWWLKSRSTKTDEGDTEWLVPEAVPTALEVMERLSLPLQAEIDAEIAQLSAMNPGDPEIAVVLRHKNAIFINRIPTQGNVVRTLSNQIWNKRLKRFVKNSGLDWSISTHQFRRKFANYVAKSKFGDLRYLKSHFKHWSMDMTLGYSLNESQEIALYAEIQLDIELISENIVNVWMAPNENLSGGYGKNLTSWRKEVPMTLFKNHEHMVRALAGSTPIRSNGHAWCTAPDNLCIGNDLERTRCSTCSNAVIGEQHIPLYRGLLEHLEEVANCEDIGISGKSLIERDIERCNLVLNDLISNFETKNKYE